VISWHRLVGALGVECHGVDVTAQNPEQLRAALRKYGLLVFRDQSLTPASYTDFAAKLGPLDVYPFAEPLEGFPHVVGVVKEAEDLNNFGGAWHSDTSYIANPPAATLLHAIEVPGEGGDTLFADMCGLFDGLSEGFQGLLESLVGHNTASLVHDAGGGYNAVTGDSVKLKEQHAATEANHPIVIEHEVGGRRALFFSLIHTACFVGMTRAESLPILKQLQSMAIEAGNVTRLKWQSGTLAIWDNRAVQHYPLNDYPGQRREMHRIILKGDRPRSPRESSKI
jgi:taurine dioxygenase